jgi:serine/threonine protein kinase
MEYLSNGSVYEYFQSLDRRLKISEVLKYATDVARGMQYLHRRGVIQRDLKSQNLLIDDFYNIKVCDFGLSRVALYTRKDARGGSGVEEEEDDKFVRLMSFNATLTGTVLILYYSTHTVLQYSYCTTMLQG